MHAVVAQKRVHCIGLWFAHHTQCCQPRMTCVLSPLPNRRTASSRHSWRREQRGQLTTTAAGVMQACLMHRWVGAGMALGGGALLLPVFQLGCKPNNRPLITALIAAVCRLSPTGGRAVAAALNRCTWPPMAGGLRSHTRTAAGCAGAAAEGTQATEMARSAGESAVHHCCASLLRRSLPQPIMSRQSPIACLTSYLPLHQVACTEA